MKRHKLPSLRHVQDAEKTESLVARSVRRWRRCFAGSFALSTLPVSGILNSGVSRQNSPDAQWRTRPMLETLEDRRLLACTLTGSEIFCESFESSDSAGDSGLVTGTDNPFSNSPDDHWNRTDGSNIANTSSDGFSNTSNTFSGQDGNFFWALEDSDADGGTATRTLNITGIDIAGYDNLAFSGLFAADGQTSAGSWLFDLDDHLLVAFQIDGGGYQTLLEFESDSDVISNRPISQDTDLNGVGDGTRLVPTFTTFTSNIPATGATLDILVSAQGDSNGEELAFDNFRVTGNPVPTVSSFSAADVTLADAGTTSYSFDITYSDDSAIDISTIDIGDVTVGGPGGVLTVVSAVESTGTNGSPRTVTYTVAPHGGSWDAGDDGTYTISMNDGEIGDDDAAQAFVAGDAITSFDVNIFTAAHSNMQPSLALNYVIALEGTFPSRNFAPNSVDLAIGEASPDGLSLDPIMGSVGLFAGNFAPRGWAFTNGQLLPINNYQALFSILGTTYGGDGRTNFALPDLRGRTVVHVGAGHSLGDTFGEEQVTLSEAELPQHSHDLSNFVVDTAGGGASLENMQPSIALNYVVSLTGVFPSRNSATPLSASPSGISNNPHIGAIGLFAGNFAPRGWAFADGQLLPISQNTALFSIFGTTYGGDGRTTFALPDLRGRTVLHAGRGPGLSPQRLGQQDGIEDVTLSVTQIPSHTHNLPEGKTDSTGGNQSHDNMQPSLAMNYVIALTGVYPSRSFAADGVAVESGLSGEPMIGAVGLFGGTFAPRGWALADGQLLAISGNDALFSILGTTYGGDGRTTFGLPDLRGRTVLHVGTGPGLTTQSLGQRGGAEQVTLTNAQLASHTHDVVTETDLAITISDSPDPVTAGNELTYTVTVSNLGLIPAENVVVTDTLPAGVTFVSSVGCNEDPGGVPTCTLGDIPVGDQKQFTLTAAVDIGTAGVITNQANVGSDTPLINTDDDSASEDTTVVPVADLTITMSDDSDPLFAGSLLTYTVTVNNQGPSPAQNVVVTDILPAGVSFVSTTGCAEDPNGVPTCSLGDIPVGSSAQYTITTAVDIGTEGVVTNVVNVASDTLLINTGDDSASEDTTVLPLFDLVVTTADDELDTIPDPDDLSLREAIEIANIVAGADTITFAESMTINLSLGQMEISDDLTITGLGADQTIIDAQQNSRIFEITDTAGDVTLVGMTLTHGKTTKSDERGGAVSSSSQGLLEITESTITGNSTTGDFADGGGVWVDGDITLTDSTISGNSARGHGGGTWSAGSITLTNGTISGNSAGGNGGGTWSGGSITLTNGTISGNSAGDAGGGIWTFISPTIRSSIVAGNTLSAGEGSDLFDFADSGTLIVENSLIGDGSDSGLSPAPTPDANGNLIGTIDAPINPLLGPLTDNGGPTLTHALLVGSPAMNAGSNPLNLDFDQRGVGFAREEAGATDMGAFEVQSGLIAGFKFEDMDADGVYEPNDGDVGLAGIPFELIDSAGNLLNTVHSDINGEFWFQELLPGWYTVREGDLAASGFSPSTHTELDIFIEGGVNYVWADGAAHLPPDSSGVELLVGEDLMFGNFRDAAIHGYKFHDINFNGSDDGEPRLVGVQITLAGTDGQGNPVDQSVQTDVNGEYWFMDLVPGNYTVSETPPDDTTATTPTTISVTLVSGQTIDGLVFGNASVNDAPVLTVPADLLSVREDQTLPLSGISVADEDVDQGDGQIQVTLNTTGGHVRSVAAGGAIITGNDTTSMVIVGLLADVNATLATTRYQGYLNFNGTETITVTADDLGNFGNPGPLTDVETFSIKVLAVNDPPAIAAPTSRTVNEETDLRIGPTLGVTDPDVEEGDSIMRLTLAAENGLLSLSPQPELTFEQGDGVRDSILVLTATRSSINAALPNLIYRGHDNFDGQDQITITVDDLGNFGAGDPVPLTATATIDITVISTNDPSEVSVPDLLSGSEDTDLVITNVTASDPDTVNSGTLEVTLAITHGELSLASTSGLTLGATATDAGADDIPILTFRGSQASVNGALLGMIFRPDSDFNGDALLTISAVEVGRPDDLASATVPISIEAVNDAPVLTLPDTLSTEENSDAAVGVIDLTDVDVLDTDLIAFTIEVENGLVTFGDTQGLISITGDGTASVTGQGPLALIDNVLDQLTFTPDADFFGTAAITISVDDQGATGIGGPQIDTGQINVSVTEVDEPAFVLLPNASGFSIQFNEPFDPTTLNLYVDDPDVRLVGETTGPVRGSLVWDGASSTLHFVQTGGRLPTDTYAIEPRGILKTYFEAFETGDTPTEDQFGNYIESFETGDTPTEDQFGFTIEELGPVVSLPDFARSPGQSVNVPADGAGLPITMSGGGAVTSIEMSVHFNPTLLHIEQASPGADLPDDWTLQSDLSTPGVITLIASGETPLADFETEMVSMLAVVPDTAPFGASQVLVIDNVVLNDGDIDGVGDRAVHQLSSLGDIDGDQMFTAFDAALIASIVVGQTDGSATFTMIDPVILANVTGTGRLSGLDAAWVAQKSVGFDRPQIPDLPVVEPLLALEADALFARESDDLWEDIDTTSARRRARWTDAVDILLTD